MCARKNALGVDVLIGNPQEADQGFRLHAASVLGSLGERRRLILSLNEVGPAVAGAIAPLLAVDDEDQEEEEEEEDHLSSDRSFSRMSWCEGIERLRKGTGEPQPVAKCAHRVCVLFLASTRHLKNGSRSVQSNALPEKRMRSSYGFGGLPEPCVSW
jgi:hypothetical protein